LLLTVESWALTALLVLVTAMVCPACAL